MKYRTIYGYVLDLSIFKSLTFITTSFLLLFYFNIAQAQQSCPVDISARIVQNGHSVLTCFPGVPGSLVNDTLAVKDVTSYGTRLNNGEIWPLNQNANTPTVASWAPADFNISGTGNQTVFSVAINPTNGNIYTASSRLWGNPPATGSISAPLTPGLLAVYSIDGTTGAVSLIVNITADVDANENFGASYVTYDEATNQLFVVGMDTGTIYRVDPTLTGAAAVLQSYNPDIDAGIAEDSGAGILAPRGERILGLAWNPVEQRLYYSVWAVDAQEEGTANTTHNTIRSVALSTAGVIDAATDQLELSLPFINVTQINQLFTIDPITFPDEFASRVESYSVPVADIEFNLAGNRMLLSETGFNSGIPETKAHRSRLLDYQGGSGTWALTSNQSRYGIGESIVFSGNSYEGLNARGGVAWGYESINTVQILGRDDYLLTTADALSLRTDIFYGYQFMRTTVAGNLYDSLVSDLDGDPTAFAKGLFGDVDVMMCAFELGNFVWNDTNLNGIQDGSEAGVPGVQVELHTGTNCGNATGITAVTNGAGLYNIPNILPGTYSLQFSNLPAGFVVTTINLGGDDELDSDVSPATLCLDSITITSNDITFDMGINPPSMDWGDAPDSAIGNGAGNYQTLSTDNGPSHIMVPDLYLGLCVDDETDGQPNTAADGDDNGAQTTITNGTCTVANDDEDSLIPPILVDAQVAPIIDVSVVNTTAANATVACWVDYNGDGVFDNTTERGSVAIGASGLASVVMPNVPASSNADTGGSTFMRCRVASDAAQIADATGAATTGEVEDFPITINPLFNLGNYVWYDANQDGIQDANELGVNGIDVNLYTTADCTGAVQATTTTVNGGLPVTDGFYEFTGLPTGDYCVEFTGIPIGHTISPTGAGTSSTDSDAIVDVIDATIARITNIALSTDDFDEDMGIFVAGSISGLLWCENDTNPNLVFDAGDGDTLQSNVTVNLYDDANCNNIIDGTDAASLIIQSTVAGNYSFTNLITGGPGAGNNPPGCYIVEVDITDPDLGACEHPITATQLFPAIDAINPDNANNNFGHEEHLTLGNYVWYDNDQNGLQDIGEPGVNGITVELFSNATCAGASSQITTTANGGMPAADGWYSFSPLANGDYCVQFSGLATAWVATMQNQGGDNTIDSDADATTLQIQNIALIANDPTNDMGIYAPIGNIPGQVYCDTNLNLTYDAGEEQSGIAVTLQRDTDCDGTGDITIATLDTDGTGSYDFINLPVGLSPIPPNPAVCYVLSYDLADTDLTGCSQPFLPTTGVVELSTDTPAAPLIVFGNQMGPPLMIPVNKWWALLIMSLMLLMTARRYKQS